MMFFVPRRLVAGIPYFLALLLYLPQVFTAGWILDDALLIRDHPGIGKIFSEWMAPTYTVAAGRGSYVWRPLVTSIWRALELVFPREPWVFRSLNVLLLLGVLVLFGHCARILALRVGKSDDLVPVLQSVLVVSMPVVASVCWSAAGFELVAVGCGLMALRAVLLGEIWGFGVAMSLGLLAKETSLPVVLLPFFAARERRGSFALLGAVVALAFQLVHTWITGVSPPVPPLNELLNAWAQAIALPVWLFYSPQAHLFAPQEVLQALPVVLGLWLVFWQVPSLRPAVGLWGAFLAPVAVGVPVIGVLPIRYALIPLGLALVWLVRLPVWVGRWLWVLVLGLGSVAVGRAGDWESERVLWEESWKLEPENAYINRQLIRVLWEGGGQELRRLGLLPAWKEAIDTLPRPLAFFDPTTERFELAKAAFQVKDYPLALEQVQQYLQIHDTPEAWCLLADAAEREGGHPELVAQGDARCHVKKREVENGFP